MVTFSSILWEWVILFLPRLAAALVIFVVGYIVAVILSDWVRRGLRATRRIDPTVAPVLSAVVRYSILIFVAVTALGQLGVQTTSLLAIIGAAGIAIGLALQGTLSNIAAGIMLLWLRPFAEGDTIETAQVAGRVREIGLFATEINTFDGVYRFVPNSSLWNTPLYNYTRNATRMTDIAIRVTHKVDVAEARAVILAAAEADPRVRQSPKPEVFMESVTDTAVILKVRAWIGSREFAATQRALLEEIKRRLDAAGIGFAPAA